MTSSPSSFCRCQAIFPIEVVLPVPFTPTTIRTDGRSGRWIRALSSPCGDAVSARTAIRRSRSCSPSVISPASPSSSSRRTTAAVVRARTSAKISASSRRSQVSSSIRSVKLAESSAVSACRLRERPSRNLRKTPVRSSPASPAGTERSPRSNASCQVLATAARVSGALGGFRRRRLARQSLELVTRQLARDDLGDPVAAHADAIEDVRRVHRPLLVRDHDELRALGEPAHEPQETVDVDVVERRLDLIEDVEGARPGHQNGEDEGQRDQRLLASGEQRQPPRRLAGRCDLDLDAAVLIRGAELLALLPLPAGLLRLLAGEGPGGSRHVDAAKAAASTGEE